METCSIFATAFSLLFLICSKFCLIMLFVMSRLYCVIIHFNLLEDLGRPSPTVTLRVFPPGLSWARSPWPLWNTTTLEPPPPQPSFFTLNSSLTGNKASWQFTQCFYADTVKSVSVLVPVSEGDRQFSLGHFLVALGEQAEELRLKGGLQQTVVLGLM